MEGKEGGVDSGCKEEDVDSGWWQEEHVERIHVLTVTLTGEDPCGKVETPIEVELGTVTLSGGNRTGGDYMRENQSRQTYTLFKKKCNLGWGTGDHSRKRDQNRYKLCLVERYCM